MMEVFNDSFAIIYEREIFKKKDSTKFCSEKSYCAVDDCGQEVQWKVESRIMRFPTMLCTETSVPYMFSPDFTYQLDFSYS